jgi:hypothetical protein
MQSYGKYVVAAALGLTATSNAWALEEFYATPGSRAMAMGGAFAAFAADSSSIWYNPAGLGFQAEGTTDFTIEYGDVVVGTDRWGVNPESDSSYDIDSDVKYVGFSTHGFGIAYFRPYRFTTYGYNADGGDNGELALVETSYDELKFGFGLPLDSNFAVGFTLDMIVRDGEIISTTCDTSSILNDCADDSDLESTSFGATIGALYKIRLIEQSMTDLKLSAIYRTDTFAEDDFALNDVESLPARPTTLGFGAALSGPLTFINTDNWGFFGTATAQYDMSEFEEVIYAGTPESTITGEREALKSEYDRLAFGVELQIITPQNLSVFLRFGLSETESDGETTSVDFDPELPPYTDSIESTSYGIGIVFGADNQLVLDYAIEDREIFGAKGTTFGDYDESLHSFSVSYLF